MRRVLKEGERWSRRRGRWKGRWPSGGPDRLLKFKLQIFFFFFAKSWWLFKGSVLRPEATVRTVCT